MNLVDQYLEQKLLERKQSDNYRELSLCNSPIDFFSNDYLGLANTGILSDCMRDVPASKCTTGSSGSRLISGNTIETELLENFIAVFHKSEAALIFNSGYVANMGLISAIASRNTTILYDELCHASIVDGIRLVQSIKKHKFGHNNLGQLKEKLEQLQADETKIVIVESVYSMDGDKAPLVEIADLCEQYHARLIVDEAHATGVFGNNGEGLTVALGLEKRVFARVHTFGKALGCHGAAVVGSNLLRNYLINFSRPFIYTTALPGHAIQSAYCAYKYISSPQFTNQPLHELIAYFRLWVKEMGMSGWIDSHSPIQALILGDNGRCKTIAANLQQAGLMIKPILYPTVPIGKERLRISLHSFNTKKQVDLLFENI